MTRRSTRRRWTTLAPIVALTLALLGPVSIPPARAADDPVLVGAGDIGDCSTDADEATATLLDGTPEPSHARRQRLQRGHRQAVPGLL
jgi:hypothetical protein